MSQSESLSSNLGYVVRVLVVVATFRLMFKPTETEMGLSIVQYQYCYIVPLVASIWFFRWPERSEKPV